MPQNTENIDDLILDFEEGTQPNTKTFGLNTTNNTIGGFVDGLAAVKQSIYLMLNTESDQHIIYPYTYGLKTVDLIGKPMPYVAAVIGERIKETLLSDYRITDVSDFEFEHERNKLNVKFVVNTIYGNIDTETVVAY